MNDFVRQGCYKLICETCGCTEFVSHPILGDCSSCARKKAAQKLRFNEVLEKMYIAMCAADQEDQWTFQQQFGYATNATKVFIEELEKLDE